MLSYVVGGPDIAPATESRHVYGRESVEDDPFIVAASLQSLNSVDGKKEKQHPNVNYGYLPEGRTFGILRIRKYRLLFKYGRKAIKLIKPTRNESMQWQN